MTIKGDGEVRQKLKQVRFRHLKREIESCVKVTARNCIHNVPLQVRGVEVGFCALKHVICDVAEGKDHAQECPNFGLRASKDEVKAAFQSLMDAPVHEVAAKYPDVAALTWVLESEPATDLFPGSTLVGSVNGVLLWADTEAEAKAASVEIDTLVGTSQSVTGILTQMSDLDSQIDSLADQVEASNHHVGIIEEQVKALQTVIDSFLNEIDAAKKNLPVSHPKPSVWSWLQSVLPWR
jgi:tetrahydromethanopterin S-methyltransferase subunit B